MKNRFCAPLFLIFGLTLSTFALHAARGETHELLSVDPLFTPHTVERAAARTTWGGWAGGDYDILRDLTLELKQDCPPSECLLVGIGRSPTPLVAFYLAAYGYSSALNLPLSLMGEGFERPQSPIEALAALVGNPRRFNRENFDEHLRIFLPSDQELNGRKLLFVDYAWTGESLLRSKFLIEDFLLRYQPGTRAEFAAFTGTRSTARYLEARGIRTVRLSRRADSIFDRRRYRLLSEYDNSAGDTLFWPVPYAAPDRQTVRRTRRELNVAQQHALLRERAAFRTHGAAQFGTGRWAAEAQSLALIQEDFNRLKRSVQDFDGLVAALHQTIRQDPVMGGIAPPRRSWASCLRVFAAAKSNSLD